MLTIGTELLGWDMGDKTGRIITNLEGLAKVTHLLIAQT